MEQGYDLGRGRDGADGGAETGSSAGVPDGTSVWAGLLHAYVKKLVDGEPIHGCRADEDGNTPLHEVPHR